MVSQEEEELKFASCKMIPCAWLQEAKSNSHQISLTKSDPLSFTRPFNRPLSYYINLLQPSLQENTLHKNVDNR